MSDVDLPAPVGLKTPLSIGGVFLWRKCMDRDEGFPPHVIGFMKRKREKEKLDDAKAVKTIPLRDESGRTRPHA